MCRRHKAKLVKVIADGIEVDAKDCSKCLKIKPLTKFNKRKEGLGGRDSRCRECFNEITKERKAVYDKRYRNKNEERIKEQKKVWWEENRDDQNEKRIKRYYANHESELAYRRQYQRENRDELLEYKKRYYIKNIDKIKVYRQENSERIRVYDQKRYQENKEKYAERWAKYFEDNADEIRRRQRDFYKANADEVKRAWREYYYSEKGQIASLRARHRRRDREKQTLNDFTSDEWKFCVMYFENKCAYCGDGSKLTVDHFIPVSKGGSLTSDNVIPCCIACNSSKRDSDFFAWFKLQDFYSEAIERKVLDYLCQRNVEKLFIL